MTEPTFTVRRLGPQPVLCGACLTLHFPWFSCEAAAEERDTWGPILDAIRTPIATDIPPALRGPNWPGEET